MIENNPFFILGISSEASYADASEAVDNIKFYCDDDEDEEEENYPEAGESSGEEEPGEDPYEEDITFRLSSIEPPDRNSSRITSALEDTNDIRNRWLWFQNDDLLPEEWAFVKASSIDEDSSYDEFLASYMAFMNTEDPLSQHEAAADLLKNLNRYLSMGDEDRDGLLDILSGHSGCDIDEEEAEDVIEGFRTRLLEPLLESIKKDPLITVCSFYDYFSYDFSAFEFASKISAACYNRITLWAEESSARLADITGGMDSSNPTEEEKNQIFEAAAEFEERYLEKLTEALSILKFPEIREDVLKNTIGYLYSATDFLYKDREAEAAHLFSVVFPYYSELYPDYNLQKEINVYYPEYLDIPEEYFNYGQLIRRKEYFEKNGRWDVLLPLHRRLALEYDTGDSFIQLYRYYRKAGDVDNASGCAAAACDRVDEAVRIAGRGYDPKLEEKCAGELIPDCLYVVFTAMLDGILREKEPIRKITELGRRMYGGISWEDWAERYQNFLSRLLTVSYTPYTFIKLIKLIGQVMEKNAGTNAGKDGGKNAGTNAGKDSGKNAGTNAGTNAGHAGKTPGSAGDDEADPVGELIYCITFYYTYYKARLEYDRGNFRYAWFLGMFYERNRSRSVTNPSRANSFYEKGAKTDRRAAFRLGLNLLNGNGVKENREQAFSYIRLAYSLGSAEAARWLHQNVFDLEKVEAFHHDDFLVSLGYQSVVFVKRLKKGRPDELVIKLWLLNRNTVPEIFRASGITVNGISPGGGDCPPVSFEMEPKRMKAECLKVRIPSAAVADTSLVISMELSAEDKEPFLGITQKLCPPTGLEIVLDSRNSSITCHRRVQNAQADPLYISESSAVRNRAKNTVELKLPSPAGKEFSAALKEAGFKKALLSNVWKCRPEGEGSAARAMELVNSVTGYNVEG